ncbi:MULTISPECIES: hypothetical protein [Pseudoalteromonas]|uniref:Uncharacterized protein n=1 Tax=Pseudoalteromonas luteoviolacea (strain 2ta16) TaxID=1353533 RepID=V4HIG4_PSEL2|nr:MULTISPECIES: hypothetical protein [Pseudoalteromonas]ESP90580.1 hypothetical protein PL2TA16_01684 [Pseudoalteromonas luteoviolacea 2ta16]KZN41849.1 hypothetical protein N483_14350 [Pseudoalteromonas luteoviolacea NCIMB 1944]MCG7550446.1 hypothetical protein [Pseudoalteromonas sp. Of7M-16]
MIKLIENTPWWFLILLYVTTLIIGTFIGAPLLAYAYDISMSIEVQRLFVLMALMRVHFLLPLMIAATIGLTYVRGKKNKSLTYAFIAACVVVIPSIFYGMQASDIYDFAAV